MQINCTSVKSSVTQVWMQLVTLWPQFFFCFSTFSTLECIRKSWRTQNSCKLLKLLSSWQPL